MLNGIRQNYLLLVALGMVGALSCRHAPAGAPTVVDFWAMGQEGEVVQPLLRAFEQGQPGIRVRVQQIPWSAAHEKLLTAYVGGTMPDVFQLGNTWIPEFVALDAIEPLDPRRTAAVDGADYFRGILDTNRIAGELYALPWYVDTRLLFYRTDVLQAAGYAQPPQTWAAWVDAMQRIESRGRAGTYAILLPLNEWQTPVILAMQLGAGLLREDDQYGDFRSPPFRRAFGFYLDLFRRGLAPLAGAAQVANLYQDFANAYFTFFVSGPWNIAELRARLPADLETRWLTAPLPAPDDRFPGVSLAGGASLAVFRGSTRKSAAWKVIQYLSAPRQQIAFYRLAGDLPARKSAWADPALRDNRYARAFWTQLENVRSTPKVPEWERIATLVGQYAEAAIRGEESADAALTALDRDVDAVLEKRRWLLRQHRPPTGTGGGS